MGMSQGGVMLPFRAGKGYTRTGKRRLVVGYGPSIARIFDSGRYGHLIRAEVEAEISRRFVAGFQRVLDSAARGYGGKGWPPPRRWVLPGLALVRVPRRRRFSLDTAPRII